MSDEPQQTEEEDEQTQVQLFKSTTGRLKSRGQKGETYDDVINRLLDSTEGEQ